MKSAVLTDVRIMEVQSRLVPEPGRGEVLIKVMACGVCGTDVHIFEGDKGAADNPLPIVLGHEFAGIVEAVGPGVPGFRPGDRVCIDPNVLCGTCGPCRDGIGHFCESMVGIGTTVDGGFAQYCTVPQQQCCRLAQGVSFAEGAMAEPLACCLHGIDLCEIQAGDNVVVIGGGMIGLLMLQLARLCGAATVSLVEPVAAKRAAAKALGAAVCAGPDEDIKAALARAGIHRVNTVIECAGRPAAIRQAISLAGEKSMVMLFGLTKPEERVEVYPFELFKKEIVLKASFINPYTINRAVALLNNRRIDVSSMVAGEVGLEELAGILASPEKRSLGKYIVTPWKE